MSLKVTFMSSGKDFLGEYLVSGKDTEKAKKVLKKSIKRINRDFDESKKLTISRLTYFLILESEDFDNYTIVNSFQNEGIYGGITIYLQFKNAKMLKKMLEDLVF